MRSLAIPLTALVCSALAPAQVPPGRVLCVTRGISPNGGLLMFEPLRGSRTPVDTTALAALRLSVAIPDRGGLILGGAPAAATDDVLLRAPMIGSTVLAPTIFVQGLRGRTVALFPGATNTDFLVVTNVGLFSAPMNGGVARALTSSISTMGNTDAALPDRALLVTTGTDQAAASGLWLFDVVGQSLRFVPLRLPAPLAVAPGPGPGTLLLGDSAGQVWAYAIATQALTPYARLGTGPIHALLLNPDQRHWLATVPGAVHVFKNAASVTTYPMPTTVWAMAYHPYESAVTRRGFGCRGTGAQPPELAALGRPTPGNSAFALTLAGAPAGALAVLLLGGDRIDVGLDRFGLTGCRLYTTPVITLGVITGATGGAQYPLPVPADPDLIGGELQAQWLVRDLGANPASFTTTNAGAMVF